MHNPTSIELYDKNTTSLLKDTLSDLVAGLAGISGSGSKEVNLSVGRIIQAVFKGKFLKQLITEWQSFKDAGKIKENYEATTQHVECLKELLEFIDNDNPNEEQFEFVKKIFFHAATDAEVDNGSIMPQQMMRQARHLSSGEILILKASYMYSLDETNLSDEEIDVSRWYDMIAAKSGLEHHELIEFYEESLVKKRLLRNRSEKVLNGIKLKPHFRLTKFGYHLCDFILHE